MPPRPRKRTGLTPQNVTPASNAPVTPSTPAGSTAPRAPRPTRMGRAGKPSGGAGGWIGLVLLLIILGVVVVVFGPEAKRRVEMNMHPAPAQPVEDTVTIIRVPPTPRSRPDDAGGSRTPAGPTASSGTRASARGRQAAEATALYKEGEEQIRKGAFRESVVTFEKIKALDAGETISKMADHRISMARFILKTERETPPSVEKVEDNLCDFALENGNTMRGILVSESPDGYTVKKNNGISMTLPKRMVTGVTPITADRLRSDLLETIRRRQEAMDPTPLGYFDLGVFCLANGLRAEAADFLQKAWAGDAELEKNIVEHKALAVLREALYFQGAGNPDRAGRAFKRLEREFPTTRTAAKAKEMLADAESAGIDLAAKSDTDALADITLASTPAPRHEPVRERDRDDDTDDTLSALMARSSDHSFTESSERNPRADARGYGDGMGSGALATINRSGTHAEQAAAAFTRASQLYARGGMSDSIREGMTLVAEARELFDESIRLYGLALAKEPGNAKLKKSLEEAKRKKYWSEKFQALN